MRVGVHSHVRRTLAGPSSRVRSVRTLWLFTCIIPRLQFVVEVPCIWSNRGQRFLHLHRHGTPSHASSAILLTRYSIIFTIFLTLMNIYKERSLFSMHLASDPSVSALFEQSHCRSSIVQRLSSLVLRNNASGCLISAPFIDSPACFIGLSLWMRSAF